MWFPTDLSLISLAQKFATYSNRDSLASLSILTSLVFKMLQNRMVRDTWSVKATFQGPFANTWVGTWGWSCHSLSLIHSPVSFIYTAVPYNKVKCTHTDNPLSCPHAKEQVDGHWAGWVGEEEPHSSKRPSREDKCFRAVARNAGSEINRAQEHFSKK